MAPVIPFWFLRLSAQSRWAHAGWISSGSGEGERMISWWAVQNLRSGVWRRIHTSLTTGVCQKWGPPGLRSGF